MVCMWVEKQCSLLWFVLQGRLKCTVWQFLQVPQSQNIFIINLIHTTPMKCEWKYLQWHHAIQIIHEFMNLSDWLKYSIFMISCRHISPCQILSILISSFQQVNGLVFSTLEAFNQFEVYLLAHLHLSLPTEAWYCRGSPFPCPWLSKPDLSSWLQPFELDISFTIIFDVEGQVICPQSHFSHSFSWQNCCRVFQWINGTFIVIAHFASYPIGSHSVPRWYLFSERVYLIRPLISSISGLIFRLRCRELLEQICVSFQNNLIVKFQAYNPGAQCRTVNIILTFSFMLGALHLKVLPT